MTEEIQSNTNVTIKVTFPVEQWKQWDAACKQDYGDVRWLKIWNDHMNTNNDYKFNMLSHKVEDVLAMYVELKQQVEKKEDVNEKIGVLGGVIVIVIAMRILMEHLEIQI